MASSGWLKNFQSRHGIRQLAIQQQETSAAHLFMYKNLLEMAGSSSLRQSKSTSFFFCNLILFTLKMNV